MIRSLRLPLAAMAALLAGACQKEDTVKIGEYASLTGKEAAFGQSSHKGTLLAIEEINAAGGVLGKRIDLITEDNQSKQGESATIVKKLIFRDKVAGVLGEVASMRSLEAAPVCQDYKVPMVSPASTNPKVTEIGDYIFRVCFIDPFQGTVMAKFAKETLKLHRVGLLTSVSSAYSVGLAKYFKERFTADGGEIAIEQKFSEGDKDFNAQLTAIKAEGVDGIFVPGYYTEAALICRQARELGMNMPLFGGDGWEAPELISIGGAAVEGCYYSTHYSPQVDTPAVTSFVAKFKARFGGEVPDAMAALGYDSAGVLVDAIRRAGSVDHAAIRDALAATRDYQGVTGVTTMDKDRNATKAAVVIMVKDGKFKFVQSVAPWGRAALGGMTEFLQQLLNGLSLGAIYALIALGYTMVYGVLRFINFAHSDVFMVGAFIGYYAGEHLPRSSFAGGLVAMAAAMVGCAVLGIAIERLVYRPLRNGPTLNVLITAIGMSLFLEYAGQLFFGATPRAYPDLFPSRVFAVHGVIISMNQIVVIAVSSALMVVLQYAVFGTRIGTAMRAVALNPKAAQLVGVNIDVVISFTFGLGSALAAAGGVLYAINYPSIDPLMGVVPGLKAFIAAVLGGIGNIPGAALGALILGMVETFVNGSSLSTYKDAIAFAILIGILLFRPAGLLGRFTAEKV